MPLEQNSQPTFAGHQTFHPRFGWLKKAVDACAADPAVFASPDAPMRLGVGKNMVEAIKFWGLATRVIARLPHEGRRGYVHQPTSLGAGLLGSGGLDPYCEDPSTLWILHWNALLAPTLLPVWWATFIDFPALEFDVRDLEAFIVDEVEGTTWVGPNRSSISKDLDCLVRMYASRDRRGRQLLDDLLDSPFRELGLLTQAGRPGLYRFVRGAKATLSPISIAYATLDFLSRSEVRTSTLTRLSADAGSPGRVFKISEHDLDTALDVIAKMCPSLSIASPGGVPQVMVEGDPAQLAEELLRDHHRLAGREAPSPLGALAGPSAWNSLGDDALIAAPSVPVVRGATRRKSAV